MGFDEEKVTLETCEALEEVTESSESTGVQLTDDQLEKVVRRPHQRRRHYSYCGILSQSQIS
jgi:coproporphyrinogen III oxidase-like Fe-S oxidoreductase